MPVNDVRVRRFPKLLLYLLRGAVLGNVASSEAAGSAVASASDGLPDVVCKLLVDGIRDFVRASPRVDVRGNDTPDNGDDPIPRAGDDDNDPALKGWKGIDVLR